SSVYLSNDDSMSLASAQRIIYAIDKFLPLYRNEIRPHEFLNYFHFQTDPVVGGEEFSVNFQMAPRPKGDSLALAVQGKKLTKESRKAAVITFILDKSGSMRSQGKMEYLKEGMEQLKGQLKDGDVINVIEFDHEVCKAIEGFVVGRDSWAGYDKTVKELEPRGSTDLHQGLVDGYGLAKKFYNPGKINRVILITDAIANTGTLSSDLMSSISKYYDTKKIALSGIGVGLDFNDELLDTLTDRGKGAYLFLGLQEAIPRVFGTDFISLLETVARDVHFNVTFPKDLHLEVFYGEEVSTEKEKVQPIHYFANSSQLFLLDLKGKITEENPQFKLKIEFTNPNSGEKEVETLSRSIPQIKENGQNNIAKARLIMAFADLLEKTALPGKRPYGGWFRKPSPEVPNKAEGKKLCTEAKTEMKKQQALYSDSETVYVMDLADKYCSRF
ncbi:MAG: VWA domain-containing protein, partial [bacterium]|nr:VWA domain-containing protein [bacterium]